MTMNVMMMVIEFPASAKKHGFQKYNILDVKAWFSNAIFIIFYTAAVSSHRCVVKQRSSRRFRLALLLAASLTLRLCCVTRAAAAARV